METVSGQLLFVAERVLQTSPNAVADGPKKVVCNDGESPKMSIKADLEYERGLSSKFGVLRAIFQIEDIESAATITVTKSEKLQKDPSRDPLKNDVFARYILGKFCEYYDLNLESRAAS